jgi:DNA-binding NtrC family response regulator
LLWGHLQADYEMPKINGEQLAKRVKEIDPNMPVLLVTGYGELIAQEDIRLWGVDALLEKLFTLDRINHATRELLNSHST